MKSSALSKENEDTTLCVVKTYNSMEKADRIYHRCVSRDHTQQPIAEPWGCTVAFKYVPGEPLIDHPGYQQRYLDQYVKRITPVTGRSAVWAYRFYCQSPRGVAPEIAGRIPSIISSSWHGDMCLENIILTPQKTFVDIDLREDEVGDVYYDLGKFYRSLMYNSLTDKWVLAPKWFESWCSSRGFDFTAVRIAAGIVFIRMGMLHGRSDLLTKGRALCEV